MIFFVSYSISIGVGVESVGQVLSKKETMVKRFLEISKEPLHADQYEVVGFYMMRETVYKRAISGVGSLTSTLGYLGQWCERCWYHAS